MKELFNSMSIGKNFINGEWCSGRGESFSSVSPYLALKSSQIWQGNAADNVDVDLAVQSAVKARQFWSYYSYEQRKEYIARFCDILEQNTDEYTKIISTEMGKTAWDARAEVISMSKKFAVSCQAYEERTFSRKMIQNNISSELEHGPLGVMAIFAPFNFPGHLPNGQIIPGLLAGNTIVLKPSDYTPRSAEFMISLWEKAGLPAGVLNLVQGQMNTGKLLSQHQDVDGIFFTGSYAVGAKIHAQLGGQPEKLLVLEMGGNNPLIVHNIADIDAAVYQTILSAFITSGQRCTCARRLILIKSTESNYFLQRLIEIASSLQTASSYEESELTFMGPLVNVDAAKNILQATQNLENQGAKILLAPNRNAANVSPAILQVSPNDIIDNEYFGPLLQICLVEDFDVAIKVANNTKYGLSASLLSNDSELFTKFKQHSKAGLVNFNLPTTGASPYLPFGGSGYSGNYRPCGYYTADHCAHPQATQWQKTLSLPDKVLPGINF